MTILYQFLYHALIWVYAFSIIDIYSYYLVHRNYKTPNSKILSEILEKAVYDGKLTIEESTEVLSAVSYINRNPRVIRWIESLFIRK